MKEGPGDFSSGPLMYRQGTADILLGGIVTLPRD